MTLPATLSNTVSLSAVSLSGLPKLWMYVGVMHIHVLVFICTYRGTCVCMHVHEDIWWCQLFSPIALHLTLWERVSQWTWDSADWQDWLVSELQRSTYLYNPPQHWGYKWMPPVLMWVLEIWTQVLMLACWELYQLSHTLSPQCCCFQPLSSSRRGWLRSGSPSFLVKCRSHIGISVYQWDAQFQDYPCSLSPGQIGLTDIIMS